MTQCEGQVGGGGGGGAGKVSCDPYLMESILMRHYLLRTFVAGLGHVSRSRSSLSARRRLSLPDPLACFLQL